MVGRSQAIQAVRERIRRVAATPFTVLVEGESGVGKELVAHEIHRMSARHLGPFVPINCAAIVESLIEAELFGIEDRIATGVRGRKGRFEQAHRGTLFLDEVADLSLPAQAKLLRVLQDFTIERVGSTCAQRIDTRVVAATNRRLRELIDNGRFRRDLYYRLSGVEIWVPPLRARREDVPLLIDHFVARLRRQHGTSFSMPAIEALTAFDWPGNVRQLARVVEHSVALALGPIVALSDLPLELRAGSALEAFEHGSEDDTLRSWTRRYVRLVYERCSGNKKEACRVLDISYRTLQTYLRRASHVDVESEADARSESADGSDLVEVRQKVG
jgi:transcriptional regulator with PAS, ATPase and Fis domain